MSFSKFLLDLDISDAPKHIPRNVLKYYTTSNLNKINFQKINIAIFGCSGSGKSSLINTIRNMRPTDEGAAPVGVTENTMVSTPYKFPNNDNWPDKAIIWDLPGCGTKFHPAKTYVHDKRLEYFDVVILVNSNRVREEEINVLTQIPQVPKMIVRGKVDLDCASNLEDYGKPYEVTLAQVREDLNQKLGNSIALNFYGIFPLCCKNRETGAWHSFEVKLKEAIKESRR